MTKRERWFYAAEYHGRGSIVARFATRAAAIAWAAQDELERPRQIIAARSALCKRAIRYGALGLPWPQQLIG